jgi:hypothetical protein
VSLYTGHSAVQYRGGSPKGTYDVKGGKL